MNIVQAVFTGVVTSIVLSVLAFLKKVIGHIINRHPDVKKARKEKELYQKLNSETIKLHAMYTALTRELEHACVQVVKTNLERIRIEAVIGPGQDPTRQSVLLLMQQGIEHAVEQINEAALDGQNNYDRKAVELEQEFIIRSNG